MPNDSPSQTEAERQRLAVTLRQWMYELIEKDEDLARDIRANIHTAAGDYVKRILPFYKTIGVILLLIGLTAGGLAAYVANYFLAQKSAVEDSIRRLALLPELLLHAAEPCRISADSKPSFSKLALAAGNFVIASMSWRRSKLELPTDSQPFSAFVSQTRYPRALSIAN